MPWPLVLPWMPFALLMVVDWLTLMTLLWLLLLPPPQ
jgi:hypothetical protein